MHKAKILVLFIVIICSFTTPIFELLPNNNNSVLSAQAVTTSDLKILNVTDSQSGIEAKGIFDYLNFKIDIYDYNAWDLVLYYSLFALNSQNQITNTIIFNSQADVVLPTAGYYSSIYMNFSCDQFSHFFSIPSSFELRLELDGDTGEVFVPQINKWVNVTTGDSVDYFTHVYNPSSWNSICPLISPPTLISGIAPTSSTASSFFNTSFQIPSLCAILILCGIGIFTAIFFLKKHSKEILSVNHVNEHTKELDRNLMVCSNCQYQITEEDIYCANCGKKII